MSFAWIWPRYREAVRHPCTAAKPADLKVARHNVEKHAWARRFLDGLARSADAVPETTRQYLEHMIPRETPGSPLFTMCPACEGAPVHGSYRWSAEDPDRLTCTICGTVYPSARYPETFAIETPFGGGQRISFYAGRHWDLIGFPFVSSWTANIRARKCQHMGESARRLAMAFALTGELACARKTRDILLRFSRVYPGYMVHSGYGEFSDLDALTASRRILDLPRPELVVPPNKPDNRLHVGYWMAGRATGVGMEGTFLADVAVAYDLTCEAASGGSPVYSPEDRLAVERDLLLEGTILLCADPGFNNKTATNRSAVGMVGLCLGDPGLVRFGLEGFRHFVRRWFLPDGMTPESPAYAYMTLEGIRAFGDAVHGYSDPAGFEGPGGRIDGLDVYGDSRYRAALEGFVHGLMPDLGYGAFADDYPSTRMPLDVADLLACRYANPQHRAVLAELCEGDVESGGAEYAFLHRDPGFAVDPGARVSLSDRFFPALRVGVLRGGADGRGSSALVSASDWGVHHHEDSLNLTYAKDGHEALTDLGYLWDRPDKHMTVRTVAHNTVIVDEADQRRDGRGGDLYAFDACSWVKLVEVGSHAYAAADPYRRSCILVDHGGEDSYLVDVFRVGGGRTHDYLFHGPRARGEIHGIVLRERPEGWHDLADAREARTSSPWSIAFDLDAERRFTAHALPDATELAIVGQGWGERGTGSRERVMTGEKVPYVVRRRTGHPAQSAFASVFEVSPQGQAFVRSVTRVEPRSGQGMVLCVSTRRGTDLIAFCWGGGPVVFDTPIGPLELQGGVAAFSVDEGNRARRGYLYAGAHAGLGDRRIENATPASGGLVVEVVTTNAESYYLLQGDPLEPALAGRTLLVEGACRTGYPMLRVESTGDRRRVYTKVDGRGYDAIPAERWRVCRSAGF